MLTNDRQRLLFLKSPTVDPNLKKHSHHHDIAKTYNAFQEIENLSIDDIYSGMPIYWDGVKKEIQRVYKSPIKRWFVEKYLKLVVRTSRGVMDVNTFFEGVKNSLQTLEDRSKESEELNALISDSKNSKQKYVEERAIREQKANAIQSRLLGTKFDKYLTESQVVEFIKQSERGLCLDELRSYKVNIPTRVQRSINEADNLKVFDNFLVLYYDPTTKDNPFTTVISGKYHIEDKQKANEMAASGISKKEIIKTTDPIIFGVILGINRLFYIDDWVNETCDLTLRKLLHEADENIHSLHVA